MAPNLLFKLKQRIKNYRLGMLVSDVKNFFSAIPKEVNSPKRRFISLKPKNSFRGNVLLSYNNKPFFLKPADPVPSDHSNHWESLQIARTFLHLGYCVDVIREDNDKFLPSKGYSFFISTRMNFDRIAPVLNGDCVKVLHIDSAHWLFHNLAEYQRLKRLQERKGVILPPRRHMTPNRAIEQADYATVLGNEFTISTYSYANKPFYRVPISSPALYSWSEDKDFEASRKRFLWFGSGGFVHKGLDLVLDAFAGMPDYHLTICGPIDKEPDFKNAYYNELYKTANVHTVGWVDTASPTFSEITKNCLGLIYPSCSEGQCGGVITCLHAGLIPIISYESGVDVDSGFGVILKDCSVEKIKNAIRRVSTLPTQQLQQMARKAWEFARGNHTREIFAREYSKFVSEIISAENKKERVFQKPVATGALSTQIGYPDSTSFSNQSSCK